ncbi:Acetyltransferase (GNAT) family protein [Microlunatus sagamiharensis]|uniref:Acetyltransferase (GNAT) family protein n=1 Tax=Microlunatus sagamiharensis TaxID=546874 RepID=A0A1H2MTY3_9ACTN|nr:GNAT family N-acetyltransferase [Microlunatus sagamiharensis]SDU96564.1 Acetyltransferase (GNAT) family protein [Microlunatus sagamiharensis]
MGAPSTLRSARPGERWVVRVRRPDGSATDLVGWLLDADGRTLRLQGPLDPTSDDEAPVWAVALDDVVVARRAPQARGGPAPSRTAPDLLEHLAVEAWAVDLEPLGGWWLRSASGFTGRANSCLAVGDPGLPVAEAAARVRAYAAAHAIPPLAQVVTGSTEDAALQELGWRETYVATDVLAVRLADLLGDHEPDPRVAVDEELTPSWRATYDSYRPHDTDPALVTRLLEGRAPRAYGSVGTEEGLVAVGRGHLSGGWLGVAALWTRPDHRRQGLATAVMYGLGRWAARRDARWCYLQVDAANAGAHAAYERLGFTLHHRYRYLAPAAD